MKRSIPLLLVALGLFASVSAAQSASALLREGDVLIGAPTNHTVNSLNATNVNDGGGYVVQVNSSDGTTTLSHAWGTADGTLPAILQTEGTYGALVQTSFESFLGIAGDGTVSYSASGTGGPVGGFDSVWLGSTPIAVEGDPIPTIPGQFWRFASRPSVTTTGNPYFVGGITSTAGGATENRGLFLGLSPSSVLLGGDAVPNLPEPLDVASTVSFDYRYSAVGTHYIAEVQMLGPSVTSSSNNAMVIDTAGLVLGGSLVQEDTVIPVSVGGDGTEAWDNFDYCGISESGDYVFSGDTNASTATDEIIVINGMIVYREGDVIDGKTVSGFIESVSMNELGEVAFVWDIVEGSGTIEALFFEGQLLLAEGDAVDWDGDGIVDPGFVVDAFTGTAALSLGSDGIVYFTADITDGTTVLEGLFAMQTAQVMTPYCLGDGSGTPCPCNNDNDGSLPGAGCANGVFASGAQLTGSGTPSVGADTLVLTAVNVEPSMEGLFFQANNDLSPGLVWGDGLRCAGGQAIRLEIRVADGAGVAGTTIGISAKAGNISPGDTKRYQYWYRNVTNPPCGAGVNEFNSSNGLAVTWAP